MVSNVFCACEKRRKAVNVIICGNRAQYYKHITSVYDNVSEDNVSNPAKSITYVHSG